MVKISGGRCRGRILHVPADRSIRPTMARVREALFSMVASRLPGSRIMDLFAGSGLLGLEALSRGAHAAVFIEQDSKTIAVLRKNIGLCGFDDHVTVIRGSVVDMATFATIQASGRNVDLVFMDPPYGQGLVALTLEILGQLDLFAANVLVVCEHEAGLAFDSLAVWEALQSRRYGDTRITMWRKKSLSPPS